MLYCWEQTLHQIIDIYRAKRLDTGVKMYKSEKGFTLVELMVVVAIIGFLAVATIPQYTNYTRRAAERACLSEVAGLRTEAALILAGESTSVIPSASESCSTITNNVVTRVLNGTPYAPGVAAQILSY